MRVGHPFGQHLLMTARILPASINSFSTIWVTVCLLYYLPHTEIGDALAFVPLLPMSRHIIVPAGIAVDNFQINLNPPFRIVSHSYLL